MFLSNSEKQKVKNKYIKFIKSQEVLSEPFRDKIGQLNKFYIPISKMIYKNYKTKEPLIIGLSGGQGSGKSTISNILKIVLKELFKLETVIFSIDDFYQTLKERQKKARRITPLFATRGVPGTHDINLLLDCIKKLKKKKFKATRIPKFDKSMDDRLPKKKWQNIKIRPSIIIFEGWCVGVTPQNKRDLLIPINKLEKKEDSSRAWRIAVNQEIKKNYKKVFSLIDKLIFLKVPNFKKVFSWRLLQEKKLKISSGGKKIMNETEIKRFIMFYERLTKHMLKTMSSKAHVIIKIDNKHKLKSIKFIK